MAVCQPLGQVLTFSNVHSKLLIPFCLLRVRHFDAPSNAHYGHFLNLVDNPLSSKFIFSYLKLLDVKRFASNNFCEGTLTLTGATDIMSGFTIIESRVHVRRGGSFRWTFCPPPLSPPFWRSAKLTDVGQIERRPSMLGHYVPPSNL